MCDQLALFEIPHCDMCAKLAEVERWAEENSRRGGEHPRTEERESE